MFRIMTLLALASGLFGQTLPLSWDELLDRAEAAMERGHLRQATASLEAACSASAEEVHAARCLHDRGLLYQLRGQYSLAESYYKAAIELLERAHPGDEPLLATTLHNLGEIYREAGRWEEARRTLANALKMRRKIYGEHPLTASTLGQLGMIGLGIGDVSLAEELLQSALSTHERLLPPTDPKRLASVHNFAQLRIAQGEYRKAIELLRGILRLFDQAGTPSPSLSHASVCGSLASLYRKIGEGARAQPLLRKAQREYELLLGEDHVVLALVRMETGMLFAVEGKYHLAETEMRRALTVLALNLGPDHRDVILAENQMALIQMHRGRLERSAELLQEVVQRSRKPGSTPNRYLATYLANLGEVRRRQGKLPEAEDCLAEARVVSVRTLGQRHPESIEILESYARVLSAARKPGAKALMNKAKSLRAEESVSSAAR